MSQPWKVLPGGLSDADHDRIEELAERGWKSTRIARDLQKNIGTVWWYMLRNGLIERKAEQALQKPYKRGNITVYPFGGEEDAFIQALRLQDFSVAKIAELATKRFGNPRTAHGIMVRLTMLAATVEDGPVRARASDEALPPAAEKAS